jgi:hypothetical protein
MIPILYVILGVVIGGLILRYFSPENAANRQEQRKVKEMTEYVKSMASLSPTQKFAAEEGPKIDKEMPNATEQEKGLELLDRMAIEFNQPPITVGERETLKKLPIDQWKFRV